VRARRQLTDANDLYRDCAVETLLPGTKYYALTTATDFLQQFVIAEFSGHLRLGWSSFTVRFGIRIPRFDIFNGHTAIKVKSRPKLKPDIKERRLPSLDSNWMAAQAVSPCDKCFQNFSFTNYAASVSITA
jgi:hypothetical protein